MSKQFKPVAKPVRRSIRREPVRVKTPAELQAEADAAREREKWRTFGGLAFFAAGIAALAVGISAMTYSRYDPAAAAAEAARFRQCYNSAEGNCVLDGDTIRYDRQWVEIAGLETPQIKDAACGDEKTKGISAAVRLGTLLNGGAVTVGQPFNDQFGRTVRKVEVEGKDVARAMIADGAGKQSIAEKRDWCD